MISYAVSTSYEQLQFMSMIAVRISLLILKTEAESKVLLFPKGISTHRATCERVWANQPEIFETVDLENTNFYRCS